MSARQLSASINAHVTPEQKAAVQQARVKAGYASDNEMMHDLLRKLCESQGVDFPTVELKTEGKAKSNWKLGKGGKFVKP